MAFDYSISKSTVCESIQWVENTFIKSKEFTLPSKRELVEDEKNNTVIVDVMECEIERSKKKHKDYYSVKKYTLKAQLVIDADSLDVVCTATGRGRAHDFKIYRKVKFTALSI